MGLRGTHKFDHQGALMHSALKGLSKEFIDITDLLFNDSNNSYTININKRTFIDEIYKIRIY